MRQHGSFYWVNKHGALGDGDIEIILSENNNLLKVCFDGEDTYLFNKIRDIEDSLIFSPKSDQKIISILIYDKSSNEIYGPWQEDGDFGFIHLELE